MKKLLYCFALFAVTSIVCLIVAYGITRYSVRQEQAVPNTVIETETVNDVDDRAAMTQEQVKPIQKKTILCRSPAFSWYSAATAAPSASIPIFLSRIFRKRRGRS